MCHTLVAFCMYWFTVSKRFMPTWALYWLSCTAFRVVPTKSPFFVIAITAAIMRSPQRKKNAVIILDYSVTGKANRRDVLQKNSQNWVENVCYYSKRFLKFVMFNVKVLASSRIDLNGPSPNFYWKIAIVP